MHQRLGLFVDHRQKAVPHHLQLDIGVSAVMAGVLLAGQMHDVQAVSICAVESRRRPGWWSAPRRSGPGRPARWPGVNLAARAKSRADDHGAVRGQQ